MENGELELREIQKAASGLSSSSHNLKENFQFKRPTC